MYDTITTVKLWGARPRHWCYVMWDWHETTSTHAVGGACNTLKFLSQLVPPIRSEGVLIVLFAFWSAWRRSIQASTCATTCLHWLVGHMSQMKHYSELTLTNRTPCGTSTKHEKSWKCLLICIATGKPKVFRTLAELVRTRIGPISSDSCALWLAHPMSLLKTRLVLAEALARWTFCAGNWFIEKFWDIGKIFLWIAEPLLVGCLID